MLYLEVLLGPQVYPLGWVSNDSSISLRDLFCKNEISLSFFFLDFIYLLLEKGRENNRVWLPLAPP